MPLPRSVLLVQLFMIGCVLFLSARVAWRSWAPLRQWNADRLQLGGARLPWVHLVIAVIGAACLLGATAAGVFLVLRYWS